MNSLKKYLRQNGINKELSQKIRKFFEYTFGQTQDDDCKEEFKYVDSLPTQLKEVVYILYIDDIFNRN